MAVRMVQLATWASRNSRAVIFGALILFGIGAGIWYYLDYQRSVTQQAAVELETLRATAAVGSLEAAKTSLNTFIQRFSGTSYADEARLMLGRLSLNEQDWPTAIGALESTVSELDTPLGFGAAVLLANAYEGQGDPTRAAEILSGAAAGARYGYQRRQALEEKARVLVDAGDYDGAVAAYDAILNEVEEGNLADRVQARRAEALATGMAAASGLAPTTGALPSTDAPENSSDALPAASDVQPADSDPVEASGG